MDSKMKTDLAFNKILAVKIYLTEKAIWQELLDQWTLTPWQFLKMFYLDFISQSEMNKKYFEK